MKKQIILTTAIVFVGLYLTFSFVKMELNPVSWTEGFRFLYCSVSIFVSFIAIGVISDLGNDNKEKFI